MNASLAPRLRVLIAEDIPDLAETLAFLVRSEGYEVELVYDGLAAVERESVYHPDVILLDIGMPKLDGYQAACQIRQHRGDKVRLFALTAWDREEDKQRAARAGFDRHMTKPVNIDSLFKALGDLEAQKQRQAS